MADRAPDETWERVARRGAGALDLIDVLLLDLVRTDGEVIALPFVRSEWVRTSVRSNTCSFSSTPCPTHPVFIEQVFDFVSCGAYFSNTRAGLRVGLTVGV